MLPASSDDLTSFTVAQTVPPQTACVFDDFIAADGTPIAGRVAPSGQTWTQPTGVWQIQSNRAIDIANAVAARTNLDGACGDAAVIAQVTMTNRKQPVCVTYLASGSDYFAATYDKQANNGGRIQLLRVSSGATAVLGSVSGVGTPATFELTLDGSTSGELEVRFDGASIITYTLTPGDLATFAGNPGVGLFANKNNKSSFDSITVL